MKRFLKILLVSFLMWIIPYVLSLLFLPLQETDKIYFKTIMLIIGSLNGAGWTYFYFKDLENGFLKDAIILGLVAFLLAIGFDMVGIMPFSEMDFMTYMKEIGFRYVTIIVNIVLLGVLMEGKREKKSE